MFAVAAAAVALEELEATFRADRREYPSYEAQARAAVLAAAPYLKPLVSWDDRAAVPALPNGSVILFATGQSAERINDEWYTPSARQPIAVDLLEERFYPVTILHRGTK